MKTNKFKITACLLAFIGCVQSCTDGFEELNRDPKNPTQTTFPAMFNGVLSSLPLAYNEMSAIHFGRYYFQSQQLGNARPSYSITAGADDIWSNYYMALKNIQLMHSTIENNSGAALKLDNVKACLDIVYAYKSLRMVDYVGDMPFFDAGKGSEMFKVKYDKQQDIYKYCIDLLKTASLALTNGSDQYSLGTGDTFLNGDITLWKKFANSLILRYAMQAATTDPSIYTPFITEILSNSTQYPLITGSESIGIWPKTPMDSHPWSFRESNNTCMGTAMWKMMSENDSVNGSGIMDPRCYVFFEPNIDKEWKAYPQSPDDNTPVQDRGPYLTSAFPNGRDRGATEQDWNNKGAGCRFSPVNFYLATNADFIPEIIMTVTEVHLLTAEAYNRGLGVSKNAAKAKSEYEAGIKASMDFWYLQIVEPCAMWVINKPTLDLQKVDNYLAKNAYSSDESIALKQIYAQIWVDAFRQPWIGFNLYRRTLATPRDERGPYNANDYKFYQVPISQDEMLYNKDNYMAATGNKDETGVKLFWHK